MSTITGELNGGIKFQKDSSGSYKIAKYGSTSYSTTRNKIIINAIEKKINKIKAPQISPNVPPLAGPTGGPPEGASSEEQAERNRLEQEKHNRILAEKIQEQEKQAESNRILAERLRQQQEASSSAAGGGAGRGVAYRAFTAIGKNGQRFNSLSISGPSSVYVLPKRSNTSNTNMTGIPIKFPPTFFGKSSNTQNNTSANQNNISKINIGRVNDYLTLIPYPHHIAFIGEVSDGSDAKGTNDLQWSSLDKSYVLVMINNPSSASSQQMFVATKETCPRLEEILNEYQTKLNGNRNRKRQEAEAEAERERVEEERLKQEAAAARIKPPPPPFPRPVATSATSAIIKPPPPGPPPPRTPVATIAASGGGAAATNTIPKNNIANNGEHNGKKYTVDKSNHPLIKLTPIIAPKKGRGTGVIELKANNRADHNILKKFVKQKNLNLSKYSNKNVLLDGNTYKVVIRNNKIYLKKGKEANFELPDENKNSVMNQLNK